MNRLSGNITEVLVDGQLALIGVTVKDVHLQVALIDNPEQSDYLTVGSAVEALFKETEVILAKSLDGHLSLENRIAAQVHSIEFEKLFCRVSMHSRVGNIVAIITTTAAKDMNLQEGSEVTAFIKTNEIMLSH